MHISERLNALFQDEDTRIADIEQRLQAARAETDDLYSKVATESLAMEEGDETAAQRKHKAQKALDTKLARVSDLEAALEGARARKERRHKEALESNKRAAEAEYAAAAAELVEVAAEVDKSIDVFAWNAKRAFQAIARMAVAAPSQESALLTAKLNLANVMKHRLKFVPGMGSGSIFLTDEQATWSQYVAPLNPGDAK